MAYNPLEHLVKIKGGALYLPVKDRVVWFREDHPDASIETQILFADYDKGLYVARAEVRIPNGGSATGHKSETDRDFPAGALEKAETGAIGRALAALGYGTAFAVDFDEGERVADTPVASRQDYTQRSETSAPRSMHVVKPEPASKTTTVTSKTPAAALPDDDDNARNKARAVLRMVAAGHPEPKGWPDIIKIGHEHYGMEELTDEQLRDAEHRAQWVAILVDKLPPTADEQEAANVIEHYKGRLETAATTKAVNDIITEARKGAGLDKLDLAALTSAANARLTALRHTT